jgi:hypothetical protein
MLVQKCLAAIVISALCLAGCQEAHKNQGSPPAIVGAWLVKIPDAPFPLHMFVFHSDGTVVQSNPAPATPIPAIATSWVPGRLLVTDSGESS